MWLSNMSFFLKVKHLYSQAFARHKTYKYHSSKKDAFVHLCTICSNHIRCSCQARCTTLFNATTAISHIHIKPSYPFPKSTSSTCHSYFFTCQLYSFMFLTSVTVKTCVYIHGWLCSHVNSHLMEICISIHSDPTQPAICTSCLKKIQAPCHFLT